MKLKIDWASHEAATFAVKRWHYSQCMPSGKLARIGVWENDKFIGVVIFGRGATHQMGRQLGLDQCEVCELTRVALANHQTPVSRIVTIACRMVRKNSPGLKAIVSYADTAQGHHGGIYQAMGWIYTGKSLAAKERYYGGKWRHDRSISSFINLGRIKGPRSLLPTRNGSRKHRYVLPITNDLKIRLAAMAKPYPKRKPAPESSTRHGSTVEVGGATPTPALQLQAAE